MHDSAASIMNSFSSQVESSYENALRVSAEEIDCRDEYRRTDSRIDSSTHSFRSSIVHSCIHILPNGSRTRKSHCRGNSSYLYTTYDTGSHSASNLFLGHSSWWLVLLYVLFMVTLASLESSARSKYYFPGMFTSVLAAFILNVGLVSIFAFGIIIQPSPLWDPQYVIPIVGMLLGNCINAVGLSTNAIMTSLVEQSHEIEFFLSFGASPEEASSRLIREAVRVGAMPMLNNMAVIGLISIPGMMTGQVCTVYKENVVFFIAACTDSLFLLVSFVHIDSGRISRHGCGEISNAHYLSDWNLCLWNYSV